jgi:hypothetical protein
MIIDYRKQIHKESQHKNWCWDIDRYVRNLKMRSQATNPRLVAHCDKVLEGIRSKYPNVTDWPE